MSDDTPLWAIDYRLEASGETELYAPTRDEALEQFWSEVAPELHGEVVKVDVYQLPMRNFYFTFGPDYTLGRHYIVVRERSHEIARRSFVAQRSRLRSTCAECGASPVTSWTFTYDENESPQAIEQYGLTEVPIDHEVHRVECTLAQPVRTVGSDTP